jgi:hypothetical protein
MNWNEDKGVSPWRGLRLCNLGAGDLGHSHLSFWSLHGCTWGWFLPSQELCGLDVNEESGALIAL